jgi:hypothetical protein
MYSNNGLTQPTTPDKQHTSGNLSSKSNNASGVVNSASKA